ncbi:MAG: stage II sporulation protein R [Clostridia bacterium]|nr:stage II sporulation protein R [Clostridia bacterium]
MLKRFKERAAKHAYILCAMILALSLLLAGTLDALARERNLQKRILRLHVVANSDSEEDQAVKLLVRDAVLEAGNELFGGDVTAENAEALLAAHVDDVNAAAEAVLRGNGMDYGVKTRLVTEYFPARAYGEYTLPAGRYEAIKIVLGEGAGQNWFCVMFPPLCLPAATEKETDAYFDREEQKILRREDGYEIRFRFAEALGRFWDWLTG